jgi:hypothetical protein
LPIAAIPRHNVRMASESYLRVTKSETRDLADREARARTLAGRTQEWRMSNRSFFAAFVAIAALVALLAIVLR